MYKMVQELNKDQLDYLKTVMFWGDDNNKPLYDKYDYYHDIPNEMVFKRFEGISFVEEDFGIKE